MNKNMKEKKCKLEAYQILLFFVGANWQLRRES